ncbi:hypothetical protein JCM8208_002772 [Rhodotorula glutinis]
MSSSDPLRQLDSEPTEPPQLAQSSRDPPSLQVEPFSAGWDSSATEPWGDAAAQRGAGGLEDGDDVPDVVDGAAGAHDDHPLAGPPFSTSSPTTTPSSFADQAPARAAFSFNPAASTFMPSFTPGAAQEPALAPISMPSEVRASSRNRSSSGASTLNVATSATPRGIPSPFSHRQTLDPADEPPRSPSPPPAPSPPRRAPPSRSPSRSPSTVSSSRGYDPTTLRNLIASSCVNGDLERLQSLMAPRAPADEGEPDPPSTFTLANQTGSHSGLAPLHYAAQKGHVEVVKWLIEQAGAMPELEDAEGETPLHKAAHRGHLDVCRFLISRNVDVNTPDHDGWTALHNAASRGSLDVARLLVDAGAHINALSKHRYSALMNAASKGQVPLVNFLVKRGADPLVRNAYGETAYDLAAAVFEVHICGVLAAAERAALSSRGSSASGDDGLSTAFNPLALHSTVPVVLYENQRLALPTLKKLSSLGGATKWTPKALSRNDNRAAYSMPLSSLGAALEGDSEPGDDELPCFRSEVRLPVVGAETTLGLPERREVRSGGRVRVPAASTDAPSSSSATPKAIRPRPTTRRTDSSAASSLTAVLAASPRLSADPVLSSSSSSAPRAEPAWIWASEWVVDYTVPASSAADGWSYAPSFAAPHDEWSPSPPAEVSRALEGGPGALAALATGGGSGGGRKFVRRRRWVRLMRRRLDLPDFGYGGAPSSASAGAQEGGEREQEDEMRGMDYRARARFLAGAGRYRASDAASVRSGMSAVDEPLEAVEEEEGRAELRKLAARLERAADELRRGMGEDEDDERRREAQDELEAFLHELALVRARVGAAEEEDAADSDDEFVYAGKDADDDARSVWTTTRPPSVASGPSTSTDYFAQPVSTTPRASLRPVLTPQMAPEFRVPTHEQAPGARFNIGPYLQPRPIRPRWEPDEATSECRRCSKRFGLLTRKHHCRRCGLVVCASCSQHLDALDPYMVALEPGDFMEDEHLFSATPRRYRTCSDCHTALSLLQGTSGGGGGASGEGRVSILSPQAFFPVSPSLGSVTPSEAAASDVSELVECPVCGTTLASVGGKGEVEQHIRDCLDTGGGTVSSGRYLVFKLPPGPLVGQECAVCFDDFAVGDTISRLVCLCTFHRHCIDDWLSRGHSCPVHPSHLEQ